MLTPNKTLAVERSRKGFIARQRPFWIAAVKPILANCRFLEASRPLLSCISRCFGHLDRRIAARYLARSNAPKLQIGCGTNGLPGWLNTDYFPVLSPDIMHLDARRPFPFGEETFNYVFSEHVIEHITYLDGLRMLAECYRVLKPFGKIRISTPDLAFLVDLVRPDKSELQCAYIKWAGAPEGNETFVINNFVRDWGHTFIYDEKTLRGAMTHAGFVKITKCDLRRSKDPALRDLENETRMPAGFLQLESLTLEGCKPGDPLSCQSFVANT
jgi:predicted SAM-dependent methyltransferase